MSFFGRVGWAQFWLLALGLDDAAAHCKNLSCEGQLNIKQLKITTLASDPHIRTHGLANHCTLANPHRAVCGQLLVDY